MEPRRRELCRMKEPVLGLLRMGEDISVHATFGKLNTQSILETAPRLRYRVQEREYQGIGKVW